MHLRWLTGTFFILALLFSGAAFSAPAFGCAHAGQEASVSEHHHAAAKADTSCQTHCIDAAHCAQCIFALPSVSLTFSGEAEREPYRVDNQRKFSRSLSPEPHPPRSYRF
ncbi:hypothetical protein SOASR030_13310 [Leminorella grimontii]|uniref:DUF2946 domain-containing protein n=1 Tax=Leminorella grimontii TaxID=82981 RepID=A0AAV5N271_9GAMM|nr:hypothetical protein [Leminorella grimontii]KFC97421.1 hypothetical protein GLGR_0356 [Leminorella grimontii ATCC 33999 = DSM 5078]GKX55219.1 hypothetical protein SOASR030_13310 [Leminorella grimontii]VFS56753.1 Uncharacterised protein [Leminorella grimontii]